MDRHPYEDEEDDYLGALAGTRQAADQVLQTILVNYGLVEDWEPRTLADLAPDSPTSTETSSPNHSGMTLRHMRRTGALANLDESAQSTLLGSTLYQYDREVPPTRAAESRLGYAPSSLNTSVVSLGANTSSNQGTQALTQLRRTVERLLQIRPVSGAGSVADISETSNSLASTMHSQGGHNVNTSADLGTTLGLLEGHLSPLEETDASLQSSSMMQSQEEFQEFPNNTVFDISVEGQGESGLTETHESSMVGSVLSGGMGRRDPARDTDDSWTLASGMQTQQTVFNGSLSALPEGERTGMLLRLLNAADFDESLVRSVRRVLQLGSVLAGDRLSDAEIQALPKIHFDQEDEQQCSICLEVFKTGELLTQLPCTHFFHVCCISRWLNQSTQCPLCRAQCIGDRAS